MREMRHVNGCLVLLFASACGGLHENPAHSAPEQSAVRPQSTSAGVTPTSDAGAGRLSSVGAPEPAVPVVQPQEWKELVGVQGHPALFSSLKTYGNDGEWTRPMYDALFPRRLSAEACKAQSRALTEQEALRQGRIFPWIYSVLEGRFTAARPQKAYRLAITYCSPKLTSKVRQVLRVVENGRTPLDFDVEPGLQLYRAIDVDGDGVDEIVVEWHKLPTPEIFEGARSIISLIGDSWREIYHTHFRQDTCTADRPFSELVSLAVANPHNGSIQIREQLWRMDCDPADSLSDIGDWSKADELLVAIPAPQKGDPDPTGTRPKAILKSEP